MNRRFGWIKDLPDFRDYNVDTPVVKSILSKSVPLSTLTTTSRPTKVDLRQYCTPIEDQLDIGACTSQIGIGLLEYYYKYAFGKTLDMSRLFLYKVTRNLMGLTGDSGASLRNTMQALVMFGSPPETYYPYITRNFDNEPTAFHYVLAQDFKTLKYFRLDNGPTRSDNLNRILTNLAAKLPCMFGMAVYSSFPAPGQGSIIPMPKQGDTLLGGHAMGIVGYDDSQKLLLVRNSWGTSWASNGYGYLPYDYFLKGFADDVWTLTQADFVDTSLFK
jgi:C1A family cysteine protease